MKIVLHNVLLVFVLIMFFSGCNNIFTTTTTTTSIIVPTTTTTTSSTTTTTSTTVPTTTTTTSTTSTTTTTTIPTTTTTTSSTTTTTSTTVPTTTTTTSTTSTTTTTTVPTTTTTVPTTTTTTITTSTTTTTNAAKKYRVNYYGNYSDSGKPPVDDTSYVKGETCTFFGSNTLKRDGYVFYGWNTKPDYTGYTYFPNDTYRIYQSDIDLFAYWIHGKYTISIHINSNIYKWENYTSLTGNPGYVIDNYSIEGYYLDQSYSEESRINKFPLMLSSNIDIYAKLIPASTFLEYTYVSTTNSYTVSKCNNKTASDVVIPCRWKGLIVNKIDSYCFLECKNLVFVQLSYPLSEIGEKAFMNCINLKDINFPNSLIDIGPAAFWNCTSLEYVSIPIGVKVIHDGTFFGCSKLKNVSLPSNLSSIGGGTFGNCYNLDSINIPDSVTSIGGDSFIYCFNLTEISLPQNLTSLESNIFYTSGLKNITIPPKVSSIKQEAFTKCNFKFISIPDSVTSIYLKAFYRCEELEIVTLGSNIKNIGISAFSTCSKLTTIYCSSPIPPNIDITSFPIIGNLKHIIVPDASLELYKTSNNWIYYRDIIESNNGNYHLLPSNGIFFNDAVKDFSNYFTMITYIPSEKCETNSDLYFNTLPQRINLETSNTFIQDSFSNKMLNTPIINRTTSSQKSTSNHSNILGNSNRNYPSKNRSLNYYKKSINIVKSYQLGLRANISVECKYIGKRVLILIDSDDIYYPIDYNAIGNALDKACFVSEQFFGDSIDRDGNEKIYVVLSSKINDVRGFFDKRDKFESTIFNLSNEGDYIYISLNTNVTNNTTGADWFASIFSHEYSHMIYFDQHEVRSCDEIFNWDTEGLATYALYLNGYHNYFSTQVFDFLDNTIGKSLTIFKNLYGFPGLFMQYIHQKYGDNLLKSLIYSNESGIKNIENATKEDFNTIFYNFAITIALLNTQVNKEDKYLIDKSYLSGNPYAEESAIISEETAYSFIIEPYEIKIVAYDHLPKFIRLSSSDQIKVLLYGTY